MNQSFKYKISFCLVLLTGIFLRLYKLSDESLWIDEIATAKSVSSPWSEILFSNVEPLYFLILKIWGLSFGITETSIRMPSVIFGSLSIVFIYLIGKDLLGQRSGLIAALLLAINPFSIDYSQEARFHGLFYLLSLVSSFTQLKLMQKKNTLNLVFYVSSISLALHSHPYSFFLLVCHVMLFLIFLYTGDSVVNLKYIFVTYLLVLIVSGDLIYKTFAETIAEYRSFNAKIEFIFEPTIAKLWETPARYFYDYDYGIFVILISSLLFVIQILDNHQNKKALLWIVTTVFSLIVLPLLISYVFMPIFVHRFTIPALTAVIFWMVLGIGAKTKWYLKILTILILLLNFSGLFDYYKLPNRDLWRETADFLNKQVQDGDLIVVDRPYLDNSIRYYLANNLLSKIANSYDLEQLKLQLKPVNRIWAVRSYGFSTDSDLGLLIAEFGQSRFNTVVTRLVPPERHVVSGYPINISLIEKVK